MLVVICTCNKKITDNYDIISKNSNIGHYTIYCIDTCLSVTLLIFVAVFITLLMLAILLATQISSDSCIQKCS